MSGERDALRLVTITPEFARRVVDELCGSAQWDAFCALPAVCGDAVVSCEGFAVSRSGVHYTLPLDGVVRAGLDVVAPVLLMGVTA